MSSNRSWVFYLFTISLFICIVAPGLFSDGMFMDGLLYAAISKNLANDLGSFWRPYFAFGVLSEFYEHPPLAIGLQSIAFRLFGDSIFVERLYSLFTIAVTGAFITLIWKELSNTFKTAWLPLLLWGTVSMVSWSYANNMLENTMAVFVSMAAYFIIKFQATNKLHLIFLGGISLSLALLSKGFVCLYIWSLPFYYWLIQRRPGFKKMSWHTVLLVLSTVLPLVLLAISYKPAAHNMTMYFNKQVVASIRNVVSVDSRFHILGEFLQHILGTLAIVVLIIITQFKNKALFTKLKNNFPTALILLLLVLSGILPIMISLKQRSFYIITVYPFLAIALAYLALPYLEFLVSKMRRRHYSVFTACTIVVTIVALYLAIIQSEHTGRDELVIADAKKIINEVGPYQLVGICDSSRSEYNIMGYLVRHGNVTINDTSTAPEYCKYFLNQNSNGCDSMDFANHEEVDLGLSMYKLYRNTAIQFD